MANLGFDLEVNKYAKQTGFDQFSTSMGDMLSEVAADAWKYNPFSSIDRMVELRGSRDADEELIPFQELNEKYKDSGIFFDQDEKQSTVDILVDRKEEERERQSIIQRGPKGFIAGTAKFGVGMVASMADPINLAMMFIPVVGQARFLALVGKYGLTKARMMRGTVEGAVGIAAVEPLVLAAATQEQSDYGLVDSLLAVTFGTLLGGGLHVGAGKLKDVYTQKKFNKRIRESRKNMKAEGGEDPAFNIYDEYYPVNGRIMKELAETDPETKRLLLARGLSQMAEEVAIDVKSTADLNPKLRNAQIDEKKINTAKVKLQEENIAIFKEKEKIQNRISTLEKFFDPKRKISNVKYIPELKKLKKQRSKLQAREKEIIEQLNNRDKLIDERIVNKAQEITTPNPSGKGNTQSKRTLEAYEKDKVVSSPESRNYDNEIATKQNELVAKIEEQKFLGKNDSTEVRAAADALEDINVKGKDYENAILEGINCRSGK
tara:strand:- start:114 stop:1583 length:1470 start_codon:yes stop_codon:yes gene_type:complete